MTKIDARNYFDAPGRNGAAAAIQRCRERLQDFLDAALAAEDASPGQVDAGGGLRLVTGQP